MSNATAKTPLDDAHEVDFDIIQHAEAGFEDRERRIGEVEAQMAAELGDEWDVVAIKVPGGYQLDPETVQEDKGILALDIDASKIAKKRKYKTAFKGKVTKLSPEDREAFLEELSNYRIPQSSRGVLRPFCFSRGWLLDGDEVKAVGRGVVKRTQQKALQAQGMLNELMAGKFAKWQATKFEKEGHVSGAMFDAD